MTRGVTVVQVSDGRVKVNERLGLISVRGGIRMDQFMDESLLVLVNVNSGVQKQYQVVDFSIDLHKGVWIVLNE